MTRAGDPKPTGLVFTEVRRMDVRVGDLYANGGTVTKSRAARGDEGKWIADRTTGRLWFFACGPDFSSCGEANRYVVVGRRPAPPAGGPS